MTNTGYLARHEKYIDRRIAAISGGLANSDRDCGKQPEKQISTLQAIIEFLTGGKSPPPSLSGDALASVNELRVLIDRWDILRDGDIVGYIYLNIQSTSKRKGHGRYFTPRDVVEYLVRQTVDRITVSPDFRVLDPACGSGQFLIALYKALMELHVGGGTRPRQAARRIIGQILYGTDCDPLAVRIARYNLMRISGLMKIKNNIYNIDYIFDDSDTLSRLQPEGFTLVIGNPPWGSTLTTEEKRYLRNRYSVARSGINTFTVFIEKSLALLSGRGQVAFLVPEAFLNIKAHSASRTLLLERTKIQDIALWGEKFKGVFAPAVSFVARAEPDGAEKSRNIVRVHAPACGNDDTETLIPQAYYARTPHSIFNVHYSRRAVNLIARIEGQDCFSLRDRAQFFLGIVTGNNLRHIRNSPSPGHPDPIIIGRDLAQYRVAYSGHYFKYDPAELQQVAPRALYLSKNKLLYKFIGRRLVFAMDRLGYYSLNNVNGLLSCQCFP